MNISALFWLAVWKCQLAIDIRSTDTNQSYVNETLTSPSVTDHLIVSRIQLAYFCISLVVIFFYWWFFFQNLRLIWFWRKTIKLLRLNDKTSAVWNMQLISLAKWRKMVKRQKFTELSHLIRWYYFWTWPHNIRRSNIALPKFLEFIYSLFADHSFIIIVIIFVCHAK